MAGRLVAIAWKTKPRALMQTAAEALVDVSSGVTGDWRGAMPDRQVTIVFEEDWAAAQRALGAEVPWTLRRANLLVSGIRNPKREGDVLRVGAVTLAIVGETKPCSRMDAQHQGLRAALFPEWRGGLTANVIAGGAIRVGDEVVLAPGDGHQGDARA